uniref:Lysine-rich matrix protein 4 n=1 Tax=Pinctada fucata TaxID=50426 RepID=C4TPD2_PINFU|nr:lysine-rich matrix protein 4 [Pinctada fucata]BAH78731.1 lysine-rich matrix protein 4 [Pinctada fucata]BAH78732.1 lysine-rich matrix protein 4 [Pinctada fucata]BAH78734.1 lysine-rich matrix protein 4 [Pinctada fucata]
MKFAAVLTVFLLLGAFSADGYWFKHRRPNVSICWWEFNWCQQKCHPWDWICKQKCFWEYKWCLHKIGGHYPYGGYGGGSSGGYGFDGYGGDDYNFGYGHRKYKY